MNTFKIRSYHLFNIEQVKIEYIFISHHPKDSEIAQLIESNLSEIKHNYNLTIYSSSVMDLGDSDSNFQKKNILKADLIIPILSADYLAWDFLFEKPIEKSLNKKIIIPVLARSCLYKDVSWIKKNKIYPKHKEPFNQLKSTDKNKTLLLIASCLNDIIGSNGVKSKTKRSNNYKYDVFISHDHDDGDFAELIQVKLKLEGISAWLDQKRIDVGEYWMTEIDESIINSKLIIVIMSPEARKSEYVTYEWSFSIGAKKIVLPILLKHTELHPRMGAIQYLDFTNRNVRPWEKLFTYIKSQIDNSSKKTSDLS
ncbi:MAG: TIR domain-containing protein [Saprospiraceae bacterium]